MEPKLRFSEFKDSWKINRLGDIGDIASSKRIYAKDYVEDGIPFYRSTEIINKDFNKTNLYYISMERYNKIKKTYDVPKEGDILVTAVGTLGIFYLIQDEDLPFYFKDGNLIWIKKIDKSLNLRYLNTFLNSNVIKRQLHRLVAGSNQKALTIITTKELKVTFPHLKEQYKIADFFKLIDEKIDIQGKRVKSFEETKKGLMQKIFSQEIRFKDENGEGFPEWKDRELGDLFNLITSRRKKSFKEGKYIVMDMGTVSEDGKLLKHKKTNEAEEFLLKGDLIMPKDDIGKGNIICKTGYIPTNKLFVLSDHVFALRKKQTDINSNFYHYYINTEKINLSMRRKVTGTAQLGINQTNVLTEELKKPCLAEQNKISNMLSLLDKKIALEKEILESLKELKKGFLQQMLI